jgi:diguanylate cyclase (GGDEF)-like protein
MPAAPIAANETDRLAALMALDIVGSPPTAEFDLFPGLAGKLFNAPIAAISFIEADRQWFKASVGLEVTETPREQSFCAHAILDPGEILYVPDATKDPRFADNALVTGAFGLRFYAGCPIIGPSGLPMGAICVIDREPRTFEHDALEQLRQLALGVGSAMRLHASLHEMRQLAHTDALTGLLNRLGFLARLQRAIEERRGNEHRSLGLLFLDLDRFKAINDLFGHAGGDAALCEVGSRLVATVRVGDAITRLGGDEFCILVEDVQENELFLLAERIHAAFVRPFTINQQIVPLQTSIGIALCLGCALKPEDMISEADTALYNAKRAGRGTTRLARRPQTPSSLAEAGRIELQDTLRKALIPPGHEPFALALQPLFDGQAAARLTGFEALVRWPQSDGQVLQPGQFIPIAEATGLVVELDRWVLNEACRLAAGWPAQLTIASNLSAANFLAGGLVDAVRSALQRHALAPHRLRLEITESVLLHDVAYVQTIFAELRTLGVQIILDDFGSGYASIAYLRDYTFSGVKIDRSFIAAIETDSRSRAFVGAIVEMTRALGIEVTAEGVETSGQLQLLRNTGPTAIQGYLLGRPMTPAAAAALIAANDAAFKHAEQSAASLIPARVDAD